MVRERIINGKGENNECDGRFKCELTVVNGDAIGIFCGIVY